MYFQKIEALAAMGRAAAEAGEPERVIDIQLEIASVVSQGLVDCAMPVTEISAAPIVMVLEDLTKEIRGTIGNDELDKQIKQLKSNSTTTAIRLDLE